MMPRPSTLALLLVAATPLGAQGQVASAPADPTETTFGSRSLLVSLEPQLTTQEALGPDWSALVVESHGDVLRVQIPDGWAPGAVRDGIQARPGVLWVEQELLVAPPEVARCTSSTSGTQP